MKWRLRRQENSRGEWSVWDPQRGYRICRYNHQGHGGTHVHHPERGAPVGTLDLDKTQEAEAVMRRYHERHDLFDMERLRAEVKQWTSESRGR